MSEYQYYEFLAIDRPLGKRDTDYLRRLSSRATITPASFVNTYNYGDCPLHSSRVMPAFEVSGRNPTGFYRDGGIVIS
jgi:hypothetical protein